jgi:hypothetical protein
MSVSARCSVRPSVHPLVQIVVTTSGSVAVAVILPSLYAVVVPAVFHS